MYFKSVFINPNKLYIDIFINNIIKNSGSQKNSFFPRVESRMTPWRVFH